MRGLMIAGGLYLLARFHRVIYPFAGLIVLAALRLPFAHEQQRKVVTVEVDGSRFGHQVEGPCTADQHAAVTRRVDAGD